MEFLQNLSLAIVTAAVPVITGFICKWLQSLYENNKNKIKNETAQIVLSQVTDMITSAVETTTSTYVKQLKADNMFNADAQKEAFNKTFEAVKKQLTSDAETVIHNTYGDVETYITNKIEQIVEQLKSK